MNSVHRLEIRNPPIEALRHPAVRWVGHVIALGEAGVRVRARNGDVQQAEVALSCLLQPQLGDEIEILEDEGRWFIMGILSSRNDQHHLQLPENTCIQGDIIQIEASQRLRCTAPHLFYQADRVTLHTESLSQHVKGIAYHTSEMAVTHATQIALSADKILMNT